MNAPMTSPFKTSSWSLFALVAFLSVGCGSSAPGPADPSDDQAASDEDIFGEEGPAEEPTVQHGSGSAREMIGVSAPPVPWAEMSYEDREMYMVGAVLPIATEMFQHYDGARYAEFSCATCHGPDGEAVHFELPSRYLPRLPVPGSPAWQRMSEGPAYRFMAEEVTPTVRTQLGFPEFNPATGEGWGCFGCHMQASGS